MALFGAEKTEVVIFTRKRLRTSSLSCLFIGQRNLVHYDTLKYLGILLDTKLIFSPHIRDKVEKITRLLH